MQALLETHYDGGAWMPRGGAASVAKTIAAAIVRRGGAVLVRGPVTKILTRPVSVTVSSSSPSSLAGGGGKSEGGEHEAYGVECRGVTVTCRRGVISNCGALNTFGKLLPTGLGTPPLARLKACGALEPSIAMAYLFVGLDGDDRELGLSAGNAWLLDGWDHDATFAAFLAADGDPTATGHGGAGGGAKDTLDSGESSAALLPAELRSGRLPAVFVSGGSAKDDAFADTHGSGKATVQVLAPVKVTSR